MRKKNRYHLAIIIDLYTSQPLFVILSWEEHWCTPRPSLNIMPLSMLEVVQIPRDRMVEQPIEVSGIERKRNVYTWLQYWSEIWHIQVATHFHISDACMSYHLLLGRPSFHKHRVLLSMYHQFLKVLCRDKKVHENAFESLKRWRYSF